MHIPSKNSSSLISPHSLPYVPPASSKRNEQFYFQKKNETLLKYLVLENFKVLPCTLKIQHNHKQCQFYHYPKDRRRQTIFYSSDLCHFIENNLACPCGDQCLKSHSCVEQLYRPEKYKMKFCSQYPSNVQNCEYGDFCSFAHEETEIQIELLHRLEKNGDFFLFKFKTVMCPFSTLVHDKAQCVYSHNWQDFRRKHNEINYSPIACPNWKFNNFITIYSDGCPNGLNCEMCHGWKEYDYHPLVFKIRPCPNGISCHRNFECPYYHSSEEKRTIETPILNNIFRYVPRNRLFNKNEETSKSKEGQHFSEDSNIESPSHYNNQDLETKETHSSVSNNSFNRENGENRKNMDLLFSSFITFDSFYPELVNKNTKCNQEINQKNTLNTIERRDSSRFICLGTVQKKRLISAESDFWTGSEEESS